MIKKEKVLAKEEISKIQELKDRLKRITEVSGVIEVQNYNIQLKKEQLKLMFLPFYVIFMINILNFFKSLFTW